jgi:hypothetical protein
MAHNRRFKWLTVVDEDTWAIVVVAASDLQSFTDTAIAGGPKNGKRPTTEGFISFAREAHRVSLAPVG